MSRRKTVYKIAPSAAVLVSLNLACSSDADSSNGSDEPDQGEHGSIGDGGAGADDALPPVPECPESTSGYATEVIAHEFGEGQDFGQDDFPEAVLGGPQGAGCCAGSLEVASLGDGGYVVLGFGPRTIVDGDGPDFTVFENPFWAGGDENEPVAELGRVAVSADGDEWHEFPCDPGDAPPYGDCAGWRPVEAHVVESEGTDPFDPEVSGGAPYDLADVGLDEARYVRVTDIAGDEAVFDLDAVAVVNGRCEEE